MKSKIWLISLIALIPIAIGDFGLSILTKILCILCLIPALISGKNIDDTKKIMTTIVVLLITGTITAYLNGISDLTAYGVDILFPLVLLLTARLAGLAQESPSLKVFATYVHYSLILNLLAIGIRTYAGVPLFSEDYDGSRFNGTLGPPATSIYYLACLLVLGPVYLLYGGIKNAIVCLILISLIMLSETRIVIGALFLYLIFVVYSMENSRYRMVSIFGVAAIALVGGGYLIDRMFFVGSEYVNLFDIFDSIDSSGRNYIWAVIYEKMELDMGFFGFGIGSVASYLKDQSRAALVSDQVHNDFLKISFNYGYIVGLIYIAAIVSYIKKSMLKIGEKFNEDNIFEFISTSFSLCLVVIMITDNVIIYHFYFYLMFLVIAASIHKKRARQ